MSTLLLSTRKGLFAAAPNGGSGNGSRSVRPVGFLGDNVTLSMVDPRDGAWYAALSLGHFGTKLHRSDDRGATWKEIAVPLYPKQPEDAAPQPTENMGRPIPWTLQLIWALEPGGADEPGVLWCGTMPGGLFRSFDRGESWSLIEPLWYMPERLEWFGGGADWPGIHSICVDPRDSRQVMIGISCGGVWRTEDRGATWRVSAKGMRAEFMPPEQAGKENIQDPHRLVQCAADPSRLWVQHHNGIFRSDDNAHTWHEIHEAGPSTFGFGVVVHPTRPDRAWFIPAIKDEKRIPVDGKLVVTRTDDGGRTFTTLSRGLPQEQAYDIVFRHALAIDRSGDRLAFGSTTGGAWVSENGGDSWLEIDGRLPPIYAVTWV